MRHKSLVIYFERATVAEQYPLSTANLCPSTAHQPERGCVWEKGHQPQHGVQPRRATFLRTLAQLLPLLCEVEERAGARRAVAQRRRMRRRSGLRGKLRCSAFDVRCLVAP